MATTIAQLTLTSTDLLSDDLELSTLASITASHTGGLSRSAITSTAIGTASGQVTVDTADDFAAPNFIYIKNTGFTSATKDTAVAADSYITIGVGGAFASGGFTLTAGEAIVLHGLGGGSDNLSEFQIDSSVAATYVEVIYL